MRVVGIPRMAGGAGWLVADSRRGLGSGWAGEGSNVPGMEYWGGGGRLGGGAGAEGGEWETWSYLSLTGLESSARVSFPDSLHSYMGLHARLPSYRVRQTVLFEQASKEHPLFSLRRSGQREIAPGGSGALEMARCAPLTRLPVQDELGRNRKHPWKRRSSRLTHGLGARVAFGQFGCAGA